MVPNGTSRFFLKVSGVDPGVMIERAARRGVLLPSPGREADLFAMQVNPTILRSTPEALAQVFIDAAKG